MDVTSLTVDFHIIVQVWYLIPGFVTSGNKSPTTTELPAHEGELPFMFYNHVPLWNGTHFYWKLKLHTVYQKMLEGENFHELVKNTIFSEKTFADCLLLPCQRMPHPQISWRKLSRVTTNCKICRSFLPQKFSCYTVLGDYGFDVLQLEEVWLSYTSTHDPVNCYPIAFHRFNNNYWASEACSLLGLGGIFNLAEAVYLVEINPHCSSISQRLHEWCLEVAKASNITSDWLDTFSITKPHHDLCRTVFPIVALMVFGSWNVH